MPETFDYYNNSPITMTALMDEVEIAAANKDELHYNFTCTWVDAESKADVIASGDRHHFRWDDMFGECTYINLRKDEEDDYADAQGDASLPNDTWTDREDRQNVQWQHTYGTKPVLDIGGASRDKGMRYTYAAGAKVGKLNVDGVETADITIGAGDTATVAATAIQAAFDAAGIACNATADTVDGAAIIDIATKARNKKAPTVTFPVASPDLADVLTDGENLAPQSLVDQRNALDDMMRNMMAYFLFESETEHNERAEADLDIATYAPADSMASHNSIAHLQTGADMIAQIDDTATKQVDSSGSDVKIVVKQYQTILTTTSVAGFDGSEEGSLDLDDLHVDLKPTAGTDIDAMVTALQAQINDVAALKKFGTVVEKDGNTLVFKARPRYKMELSLGGVTVEKTYGSSAIVDDGDQTIKKFDGSAFAATTSVSMDHPVAVTPEVSADGVHGWKLERTPDNKLGNVVEGQPFHITSSSSYDADKSSTTGVQGTVKNVEYEMDGDEYTHYVVYTLALLDGKTPAEFTTAIAGTKYIVFGSRWTALGTHDQHNAMHATAIRSGVLQVEVDKGWQNVSVLATGRRAEWSDFISDTKSSAAGVNGYHMDGQGRKDTAYDNIDASLPTSRETANMSQDQMMDMVQSLCSGGRLKKTELTRTAGNVTAADPLPLTSTNLRKVITYPGAGNATAQEYKFNVTVELKLTMADQTAVAGSPGQGATFAGKTFAMMHKDGTPKARNDEVSATDIAGRNVDNVPNTLSTRLVFACNGQATTGFV